MVTTYYLITHRSNQRGVEQQWSLVKQLVTQDGVTNEVIESGLTLADATAMLIGARENVLNSTEG